MSCGMAESNGGTCDRRGMARLNGEVDRHHRLGHQAVGEPLVKSAPDRARDSCEDSSLLSRALFTGGSDYRSPRTGDTRGVGSPVTRDHFAHSRHLRRAIT